LFFHARINIFPALSKQKWPAGSALLDRFDHADFGEAGIAFAAIAV
jgi:hypothetical protein